MDQNDHFTFQSHMVSSCNASDANPHMCVIKLVNQRPTHHSSQSVSREGR